MNELWFVAALAALFAVLMIWAFKTLPGERWQMLAAMPLRKHDAGHWDGLNLTFYGVFSANAYVVAVAILVILMRSVDVPTAATLTLVAIVLAVCVPASRLVAQVIEGKKHTFTVGGASFVGMLIIAPAVALVNAVLGTRWGFHLSLLPTLAAVSIAYACGESLGRLACLSFGCCYGKPLDDCPGPVRRLIGSLSLTFVGQTKKANYEGGYSGRRLVPIQAITATVLGLIGLTGILLFYRGWYGAALLVTMGGTQVWRVLSEFLRADFRGHGKLTVYQGMALSAVPVSLGAALLCDPAEGVSGNVVVGLAALWHPGTILFLQALWLAIFLFTGRSEVTNSTLSFRVRDDRI